MPLWCCAGFGAVAERAHRGADAPADGIDRDVSVADGGGGNQAVVDCEAVGPPLSVMDPRGAHVRHAEARGLACGGLLACVCVCAVRRLSHGDEGGGEDELQEEYQADGPHQVGEVEVEGRARRLEIGAAVAVDVDRLRRRQHTFNLWASTPSE